MNVPKRMPEEWRNSPYSSTYRYFHLTEEELVAIVDAGIWNRDLEFELRIRELPTNPYTPPFGL